MKTLENKVAVVTGASKGIGSAIAKELAKNGAAVIVNYAGSKSGADETVAAIEAGGGKAIAVQGDVSKKEDVARLFDASLTAFGKIDILVNNAGIMIVKPLKDSTDEDFEKQFDINVKGTFNTLREAATKLADNGSIINFSTTVTRTNFPGYSLYTATKAAVDQFTRIFAKEVGNRGINVNSVQPGPTATDLFLNGKSDEAIAKLASTNAFNRLGTPEDIAKVVAFLASDEAKWISGQNIGVNGTFYLIGSSQVVNKRVDEWRAAAKRGHELGNHSMFHPCDGSLPGRGSGPREYDLSKYTVTRAVDEIRATNTLLKAIDGKDVRTFAYPCGDLKIGNDYFYDKLKNDFAGARGTWEGLQTIDQVDLSNIRCYGINGQSADYMIGLVKKAQQTHTLLVFLFHGVGGGHGINVSRGAHSQLLHYLKDNEQNIWIAPMVDVAERIKAFQAKGN